MFTLGIEDIISLDSNLEFLIAKLRKIQVELDEEYKEKNDTTTSQNTHGLLSDIDLIDIIQMMGGSNRTAKLSVIETQNSDAELLVFFEKGKIIFASYENKVGADAVYQAIGWKDGCWNIQAVNQSELPKQNNDLPNESILMEGCRLLDEAKQESAEV